MGGLATQGGGGPKAPKHVKIEDTVHIKGTVKTSISGNIVQISGQAVITDSGSVTSVSGNIVQISGQAVITDSGSVTSVSGNIVQISGQIITTATPIGIIATSSPIAITANSGGQTLALSGSIVSLELRSLVTNSGDIYINGTSSPPFSGFGYILRIGDIKEMDIDNFNKVLLVATVSGDKVAYLGSFI